MHNCDHPNSFKFAIANCEAKQLDPIDMIDLFLYRIEIKIETHRCIKQAYVADIFKHFLRRTKIIVHEKASKCAGI